jgi:hypothetical protein
MDALVIVHMEGLPEPPDAMCDTETHRDLIAHSGNLGSLNRRVSLLPSLAQRADDRTSLSWIMMKNPNALRYALPKELYRQP